MRNLIFCNRRSVKEILDVKLNLMQLKICARWISGKIAGQHSLPSPWNRLWSSDGRKHKPQLLCKFQSRRPFLPPTALWSFQMSLILLEFDPLAALRPSSRASGEVVSNFLVYNLQLPYKVDVLYHGSCNTRFQGIGLSVWASKRLLNTPVKILTQQYLEYRKKSQSRSQKYWSQKISVSIWKRGLASV